MTTSSDPRGGLFIDSGDGRGPIHTDDMTDAERAAHGLPPKPVSTPAGGPAPDDPEATATPEAILIEDETDGR